MMERATVGNKLQRVESFVRQLKSLKTMKLEDLLPSSK
jgi:hypothetical protein